MKSCDHGSSNWGQAFFAVPFAVQNMRIGARPLLQELHGVPAVSGGITAQEYRARRVDATGFPGEERECRCLSIVASRAVTGSSS